MIDVYDVQRDLRFFDVFLEFGRDVIVGDDGRDLIERGDMRESPASELAGVEHGDHFLGGADHGLVEAGFLQAGGGEAVFDADAVDTEEQFVAKDVLECGFGDHADRRVGDGAHRAAEHDDREAVVVVERDGDVQCVGNDGQVVETFQVFGDFHGRGAGIEDDPFPVVDHGGRIFADQLFFPGVEPLFAADRHVVEIVRLVEDDGAAFYPDQQLALFQDGEVFPDGHFGHAENLDQLFHEDTALRVEQVQYFASSFFNGIFSFHGGTIYRVNAKVLVSFLKKHLQDSNYSFNSKIKFTKISELKK